MSDKNESVPTHVQDLANLLHSGEPERAVVSYEGRDVVAAPKPSDAMSQTLEEPNGK